MEILQFASQKVEVFDFHKCIPPILSYQAMDCLGNGRRLTADNVGVKKHRTKTRVRTRGRIQNVTIEAKWKKLTFVTFCHSMAYNVQNSLGIKRLSICLMFKAHPLSLSCPFECRLRTKGGRPVSETASSIWLALY